MYYTIKKIIKVNPYTLYLLFNNDEVRSIDFKKHFIDKAKSKENPITKLLDKNIFCQVDLDKEMGTIFWNNLLPMKTKDGKQELGNYDFCPNVLYKVSEPVAGANTTDVRVSSLTS